MTEYQAYPEYKDSGVEWLGPIPSTWEVSQIRRVTECCDYLRIPVNSGDRMDMKGDIPYWGANSIQGYVNKALVDFPAILVGEDGAPFMDKSKEVSFAIDYPFWPNNHVHVLKAKTGVNYEYISRALNVVDYSSYIKGSTRQKLNQGDLMGIRIPLPSLEIQHQIVKFLKRETAHIDAGIANMESLIALLTEKRSALISEVVTRGIPGEHTEFKDSGVAWLGEIPAGWDIAPFRRFFEESSEINGETPVGKMVSISGYRGVEYKEYSSDEMRRSDKESESYRVIRPGQLAVNTMWLNYGGLGVSEILGHMSPAYRAYNISDGIDKKFAHHLLRSSIYIQGYTGLLRGLRPNSLQMSRRDLEVFPILQPSKEEQARIGNYIEAELPKIDEVIDEAKNAIALMKEKRQTLISDVVTGKIDVTNSIN